jgi:predicted transcriptional regulator
MGKTVYSLVLDDALVAEVDRLAYHTGTNRSGLINRILAEYLSFTTPEKRIHTAFEEMERWMEAISGFRVQTMPSESMRSLQSALTFKYNPSIRYTVELYREQADASGELRVGLRTQNKQLLEGFRSFLLVWAPLEEMYLGQYFPGRQVPCAIDHDRYRRRFRIPEQEDSRILGQAVAQYIRWFDQVLKAYFARLGLPDAADAAQASYLNGLQQTEWII